MRNPKWTFVYIFSVWDAWKLDGEAGSEIVCSNETLVMDSINQQQSEQNRSDLSGGTAIQKMKSMCEKKTCFFCTGIGMGQPFVTRPMSVQQVDESGNLWFLSAGDSLKNIEIQGNSSVQLLFQGSAHADFVALSGNASITKDRRKIEELWEPLLKTWFTEGVADERITVIKVEPDEGYYWDTKHGKLVAFVKQVAGAATGKTMDDSIEGKFTF